jgi:hypothetical protein
MRPTPATISLCLAIATGCDVINDGLLTPGQDAVVAPTFDGAADSATPADAAPDATVVPNLRLYYAFEDEGTVVVDQSGRGLDGVLSDPTAWTASGRNGRGLSMSGAIPATQYVSLPNGILTDVDDFTITVWTKLVVIAPWARIYDIGYGLADPAARFMFLTVSGYSDLTPVGLHTSSYGGSPTAEALLSANAALPTGVRKHITLTGSGGERQLYVDGFPIAAISGAPDVPPREMEPLSPSSWLGRSRFNADPGLNGSIDELRIHDRVLSASEIQDLAWPQSDYSHWRFDEGRGTTAADTSDIAISTTLVGDATWTQGRLGGALDLPGGGASGPHVVLATSPLASCTDELTIAAWIKPRSLTPWTRVFDFGTDDTAFIYLAPTDGIGVHFAMVSPAGMFDLVSPTQPFAADDSWHHIAVTVDDSNLAAIYVDGLSVAQAENPTVRPGDFMATTSNWLGRSRFGDPSFDGAIDELRISCRAFTPDEIRMLASHD